VEQEVVFEERVQVDVQLQQKKVLFLIRVYQMVAHAVGDQLCVKIIKSTFRKSEIKYFSNFGSTF
jgi:hypothetical protein